LLRIVAQYRSFAGEVEATPAPKTFKNSGNEKGNLSYLAIIKHCAKFFFNAK